MKHGPVIPCLMTIAMSGNMQFDPRTGGQNVCDNQNPIYYKKLFHPFPILYCAAKIAIPIGSGR